MDGDGVETEGGDASGRLGGKVGRTVATSTAADGQGDQLAATAAERQGGGNQDREDGFGARGSAHRLLDSFVTGVQGAQSRIEGWVDEISDVEHEVGCWSAAVTVAEGDDTDDGSLVG